MNIGIKYGPEGRVANKAEELMSTPGEARSAETGVDISDEALFATGPDGTYLIAIIAW